MAKSLTFGAQPGRGSDDGCVIKRTLDPRYAQLIQLVHKLAQVVEGQALPYLVFQILKLEQGQVLNQHRDYHNHPDLTPNDWDTLSRLGFPVYMYDVASLQMRRLKEEQQVPIYWSLLEIE